jgi:hypothetical protein
MSGIHSAFGRASSHWPNAVHMVRPEPAHVDALVALLSGRDIAAFRALGTGDPGEAIRWGIGASPYAWAAMEGDEPLCIGGVVPVPDGTGRPWMVSQPGLERHKKRLLRESRAQLAIIREAYPALENYVSIEYPKSLRWLAWLGFRIGGEEIVAGARVRRVSL